MAEEVGSDLAAKLEAIGAAARNAEKAYETALKERTKATLEAVDKGMAQAEVARRLGVGRTTVTRMLAESWRLPA